MNAAKRTKASAVDAKTEAAPGRRSLRLTFSLVLLAAALAVAARYGWQQVKDQVAQDPAYMLEPDCIEITPPPSWIRANILADAVRDGGLAGMSILERDLTVKIARAFSLQTWVRDVRRVRKEHPARVVVDLTYRKPVAMVEVTMNDRPGLLPVDQDGVLLPPSDFSAEQARDYLRISLTNAAPAGPVGTPWGDPRVTDAARIAMLLDEHWKQLGLYRVSVEPAESSADSPGPVYVLTTRRGTRVVWGTSPQLDVAADVKQALAKLERLRHEAEQRGPLDNLSPSTQIDLRQRAVPAMHTARAAE